MVAMRLLLLKTAALRLLTDEKISLLVALCCITAAQAGLFEDDEARRAILDARKKIETQSEVIKKILMTSSNFKKSYRATKLIR